MTHPGNATIRRQKRIGIALLAASILFVALSGAGLIFPRVSPGDPMVIHFDVGSRVASEDAALVSAAADALLDAPQTIAVITGHSGSDGDPQANMRLSQTRAETVASMLAEAGIPADRVVTRGAAGMVPVAAAPDESPASVARRTKRAEIRIVERSLLEEGAFQ